MTMSDPIADMLTRIRNANTAKHDTVDIPSSKMKMLSQRFYSTKDILQNTRSLKMVISKQSVLH